MLKTKHSRRSVLRGLAVAAPAIILSSHLSASPSDQEEAAAIIKARVAKLDARLHGHRGFQGAYVYLAGGGHATYTTYAAVASTATIAANEWVALTKRLDDSVGTLFWRRYPSPKLVADAWTVSARLAITDREPATGAEALADCGDDEVWAETRVAVDEARERYFTAMAAGIVKC